MRVVSRVTTGRRGAASGDVQRGCATVTCSIQPVIDESADEGSREVRIVWRPLRGSGAPGGEQAHLFGPYWATVARTGDVNRGEWSWNVVDVGNENEAKALGYGINRHDAKRAVLDWAAPRAPRSWRRRLRVLRRSS